MNYKCKKSVNLNSQISWEKGQCRSTCL